MTSDQLRDRKNGPFARALLAHKGNATASGFAGAPELAVAPGAAPVATPFAAPGRARVMIVEDNALNLKMMTDLFEGNGYRAVPAVDGRQALALARAERPDLIVMDIQLPGLSGLEVLERLKADTGLRAIPVIAVSAMTRREDEETVRCAGCDAFLGKPISVDGILSTVAGLLGR